MVQISAGQISRYFNALIRINEVAVTASSTDITSILTDVLLTAGDGGVPVPLQVADVEQEGVISSGLDNTVRLYDSITKQPLKVNHDLIYGVINQVNGTYILQYFQEQTTTDIPYTFVSTTNIDFEFPYRFSFETLPSSFALNIPSQYTNIDSIGSPPTFTEVLTVTTINTISPLTKTPTNPNDVFLIINGINYHTLGTAPAFTLGTDHKQITWNQNNAKFQVKTSFDVIARYPTNE